MRTTRPIYLLAIALAVAAVAPTASAWTCTHQDWKASECCPLHPTDPYCQPNHGQKQGQGQGQGQIATGGNSYAQGGAGGSVSGSGNSANRNAVHSTNDNTAAGGDSTVTVNTTTAAAGDSGNDSGSSIQFLPPVVPPTPPTVMGVGNIEVYPGPCGPRQVVIHQPIVGYNKSLFHTSSVPLGEVDSLAPAELGGMPDRFLYERMDDGSTLVIGSQAVTYVAVIGTSSASSLAIGGGSGSGNWGQAGGGSSGGFQQLVTRIVVQDCVYTREGVVPLPPVAPPAPVVHRHRVHHASNCTSKVVQMCPKQ